MSRTAAARIAAVAASIVAAVSLAAARGTSAADIAAVREIAQGCEACHGPGGNSTNAIVPSISRQPRQFIVAALFMFREGQRKDPQMSAIAAPLTNADINDLAAYFSAQPASAPTSTASAETVAIGKQLTEQNFCVQCHARTLMGQQHIPRIAGQQAGYLRAQLQGFKASTRADLDGVMTSAAQPLSAHDIDVLSDYLASLDAR